MTPRHRIAILTHSVNARGGVVHPLELAGALNRLGHDAVVHAPDPDGRGFFRRCLGPTVSVAAGPAPGGVTEMVEQRIRDYVAHFERSDHRSFDVYHAQDGISGNALAVLKACGLIRGFIRTVHHMDDFADPRLQELQHRSIAHADRILTVSRMWSERIAHEFGRPTTQVGNGVDLDRFNVRGAAEDEALRRRLNLGNGPILLSVGGIEERKNSLRILAAFCQLRQIHPDVQLVIAGGASVLDHGAYQQRFKVQCDEAGLPPDALVIAGVMQDREIPALYRIADALIFPSQREGFGLVVLEAMACGCPVVAAHIAPFTEYLGQDDVVWCDPLNVGSIANAMATVISEPVRSRLIASGQKVARCHGWLATAHRHLPVYNDMREPHLA
ncbi:glycosyl transferase family 1 [Bradyrhizobium sp. SSBR45G]|uniref:MSMEG_0565 family glycosyltransferase n=1 Tax=unclassified Bradyrhizobium TaxID=2631580 RepID=UPI002342B0E9|nr:MULTISPECIES: MSMEG_0565 family glycosyltransferase [unclassified Bradyrhizobium]GLH77104.1 glycosyl transferase family 1 [Bradyrhizobium sp. SSBR45G]GLH83862.1 glycosyl transferase family 1 [Bradyrhizobium sp. SSBR45R]